MVHNMHTDLEVPDDDVAINARCGQLRTLRLGTSVHQHLTAMSIKIKIIIIIIKNKTIKYIYIYIIINNNNFKNTNLLAKSFTS